MKPLLSLIAGGLYALCYPSVFMEGWFPLLFISMAALLWCLESAENFKQILIRIFSFNLGLNLIGFYWIPHTLREFGQLPYAVSVFLGVIFSLILQPHWWLYAVWKFYRPSFRWSSENGIILSALIITLMERYFPQQFPIFAGSPWLHLAPFLGLAPYLGVAAFSFMTYWVCLEAVTQLGLKKFRPQVWVIFGAFLTANAFIPLETPGNKKINVRIVQANIGNFLKVQSERGDSNSFEAINKKYIELSVRNTDFKPDLVVWPETAYPNAFNRDHLYISPIFNQIMTATGAEMLIGGYDEDTTKSPMDMIETVFNSSLLLSDNQIKASYHKNILIPFGETLPFGPLNRQIVSIVPAVSLFARGEGTPKMELKNGLRFVTPICYEILESNYMRGLLNQWGGNHFIVNHTNDSWYGDTAEPLQHLFLSRWRALEFQLPIIRSTNTGITSVIFPDGSESRRLGVGAEDTLDVKVTVGSGEASFYQRFGVYPLCFIALILFGLTWWRERNENQL